MSQWRAEVVDMIEEKARVERAFKAWDDAAWRPPPFAGLRRWCARRVREISNALRAAWRRIAHGACRARMRRLKRDVEFERRARIRAQLLLAEANKR